ncbi:BTAD domain-containing putative transcriptional regulator [Micromonospora sp. WMMA1363]|uniref:BTAD domain-containing putative transcriptional regulator n=1 Tax=Micromonospora sp. WMMA1363 TaxID=3053985 RepID=UPI00259CB9D3|nr:BTAD domain-containing putative transcriptional regulator [Micromonospora sp. WMMA1363]MDM4721510.1 BTAD domain-containing putative transcriptional regulator [Micromonospora sp. WMMA1363]
MGKISIGVGGKRSVNLGPPRQRALFALLLINAGRTIPMSTIIDSLWSSDPPPSVRSTVYSYVSRLRQVLDTASDANRPVRIGIRHYASGYMLETDLGRTDFVQFQSGIELASELSDQNDLSAAKNVMESTLALWRGTPYSELAAYEFAVLEATRIEQLRVRGLQIWADVALGLHQYDEVIGRLGEEVRRNPMQERLGGRLMQAQYHSGQSAEALVTYESIRSYLATELGVDASNQLQRLHQAVLRNELSAGEPVRATLPGVSAVASVIEASPRRLDPPPPPADEQLVGRLPAMERLRAMAGSGGRDRMLLVVGEQGVGKTFLLQAFERELVAAGTEVIWARGERSTDLPELHIWWQVIVKARRHLAQRSAAENGRDATVELADALPDGRPTYEDVYEAISDAAGRTSVTLFLEDLHFTDGGSLQLLRRLVREARETRLTVIATVREHAVSSSPELQHMLSEILQEDMVDDILLTPFSLVETQTVVENLRGGNVPWDLVSNLHRSTGGNPFLLTRLAGSLDPDSDPRDLRMQLPFRVKVVVRGRLADCPPDVLTVIEACAVIGTVVERRLLFAVLHLLGRPLDAVHDALRSGLILSDPADRNDVYFAQEVVRELVLEDMTPTRRAELHHIVSKVLAVDIAGGAARAAYVEVGFHCQKAALAIGTWEAIEPLIDLAEQAAKRLRLVESRSWLRQAASILHSPPVES